VGVGAYHPEAARYANYVSGSRRASGMSLFSVGGNVGFALGPVLVTPLVLTLGLGGTVWLIVPSVAVAVLLLCGMAHLRSFRPQATASPGAGVAPPPPPAEHRWGPFSLVAAIAAFRSGAYFGLQAFVPSYFIAHFAASAGEGNAALTVIQRAGGQLHPARPGRLLYDRQLLDHGGTGAGVPARSDRDRLRGNAGGRDRHRRRHRGAAGRPRRPRRVDRGDAGDRRAAGAGAALRPWPCRWSDAGA